MFGIGMPELILILAVALIVIGPKKLPDLAKSLGRALGEFKRATNDLKESIQSQAGLDDVRDSFKEVKTDLRNALTLEDEPPAPIDAAESQPGQTDTPSERDSDRMEVSVDSTSQQPVAQDQTVAADTEVDRDLPPRPQDTPSNG
jgi:sec-independent protein translocase protein TatB